MLYKFAFKDMSQEIVLLKIYTRNELIGLKHVLISYH